MKQNIEKLCRDFRVGGIIVIGLCKASFIFFKKSWQGSAGILADGFVIQR